MESVKEIEVVERWLDLARDKSDESYVIDADVPANSAYASLIAHEPDSAAVFRNNILSWYQATMSVDTLRDFHTVWNEVETIEDAAQSIYDGKQELPNERVEGILEYEQKSSSDIHGPIIVAETAGGCLKKAEIHDGNHRATALVLKKMKEESLSEYEVYYGKNPPWGQLRNRIGDCKNHMLGIVAQFADFD